MVGGVFDKQVTVDNALQLLNALPSMLVKPEPRITSFNAVQL
jgi:hypothetical protein